MIRVLTTYAYLCSIGLSYTGFTDIARKHMNGIWEHLYVSANEMGGATLGDA